MALSIVEVIDITATTDAAGMFTYNTSSDFTQVVASASGPRTGWGTSLTSVTAEQTGPREVTVKCWTQKSDHTVWALANAAAHVTLVFYNQ